MCAPGSISTGHAGRRSGTKIKRGLTRSRLDDFSESTLVNDRHREESQGRRGCHSAATLAGNEQSETKVSLRSLPSFGFVSGLLRHTVPRNAIKNADLTRIAP